VPYNIRKSKCKQSDGDSGSYVLSYTDNKGKKHRNCHTSRKKAKAQIAAIEMPEGWKHEAHEEINRLNEELSTLHEMRRSELTAAMRAMKSGEEMGYRYDEKSESQAQEIAEDLISGEMEPEEVPLYLVMNVASWLREKEEEGLRTRVLHHAHHGLSGVSESRRGRPLTEAALRPDSPELEGAVFEFGHLFSDLIKLHVWRKGEGGKILDTFGELTVKKIDDSDLPCDGAWEISWAKSNVNGLGPLMYDAMMEYIAPDPLTSDRISVSDDARAVWDYYLNRRRDVRPVQLDDEKGTLTPKKKSDDCNQTAARFRKQPDEDENGEYVGEKMPFFQSPLSKAYRSKGTPTLDALKKLGMLA
jgi:hypothetical protein